MPSYDVRAADDRLVSRFVKTAVSPRPIAWVSTRSEAGVENLAPFSAYNYVSSSPPVVQINTGRRSGALKDTARNAIETGVFAVNVVTADDLERMDRTSEALPPETSEFDVAGIERTPCASIDAPRVADAAACLECTLHDTLEVYDRVCLLGDVRHLHVDEAVLTDGEIDSRKLHTAGRLGGPYYTVTEPVAYERRF